MKGMSDLNILLEKDEGNIFFNHGLGMIKMNKFVTYAANQGKIPFLKKSLFIIHNPKSCSPSLPLLKRIGVVLN